MTALKEHIVKLIGRKGPITVAHYMELALTHPDANTGASEVVVLDARQLSAGPLARVQLPQRVPVGFHACWVDGD